MFNAMGSIGRSMIAMVGTAIAGSALLIAALAPSHAVASPLPGTAIVAPR